MEMHAVCISMGYVMNKKVIVIGIILIGLGALAGFIATSTFNNSMRSFADQVLKNATITSAANSFSYAPISLSNASQIYIMAGLNKSANFYLMNSSAFNAWSAEMKSGTNANGIGAAVSLEKDGAIFIARNSTFIDTASPAPPNSTEEIVYSSANALEPAGTYYTVLDNTNGSASSNNGIVTSRMIYYAPGTVSNSTLSEYKGSSSTVFASSISFLALVVAGIILIIYGIVKRPKPEVMPEQFQDAKKDSTASKAEEPDNYISSLYDKIEGRGKKGKKSKD